MNTSTDELPMLDPFDPTTQNRLNEHVAELHSQGHWIHRTPMWLSVIDYEAARELWRDDRLTAGTSATILELQGITDGPLHERAKRNILSVPLEDHTRIRRLVSAPFTPRSIDRLRPMMRTYLHERIDELGPAGRCEFVADFANGYPIAVICEILGAPRADWPLFSRLADSIMKQVGFAVAEHRVEIESAIAELEDYVDALIDERRRHLQDDLLSELVAAADDDDRLTALELRDLVTALLLGGTDTTRNQLGIAVMCLARYPDQWDRLSRNPSGAALAVDEILRFDPTGAGTLRIVSEDVTYRGLTFEAGAVLLLSSSAANRDPKAVSCPHQFDTTAERQGFNALTFGTGRHYCLGANLARAELQEALAVLPARLHNLRLDGEPELKPFLGLTGPARLPITFDPTN